MITSPRPRPCFASLLLATACLLAIAAPARATEPLKDYSFVRGVCHGLTDDQATLERELGYAQKLRLNSTRVWLDYRRYARNPAGYVDQVRNYVRTAQRFGLNTMPILWNGNIIDPAILRPEFWKQGDEYVAAIVNALKDEPGLFVWDVMNEPLCNDYMDRAPATERAARREEFAGFLKHYCPLVKQLDPKNALTVGHTFASEIPLAGDLVDVLCFHDYGSTRQEIERSYATAEGFAKQYGKGLINSELGCIGRANPYDTALEICEDHHTGWYVFNLIIRGYWSDIHGLVYPDGTIRDPAVIAAIYGFHRNRDLATTIPPNPNKERAANRALEGVRKSLEDDATPFRGKRASTDGILDAAEVCANLLEASEMVSMEVPPTAKIRAWRNVPEKERNVEEIRAFAYELAQTLKQKCQLF